MSQEDNQTPQPTTNMPSRKKTIGKICRVEPSGSSQKAEEDEIVRDIYEYTIGFL
jgi:hypothetical protein